MRQYTGGKTVYAKDIRPMPDWLRDALNGKAGTKIVPLNKAAGAKRNLSIGEIDKLLRRVESSVSDEAKAKAPQFLREIKQTIRGAKWPQ